LLGFDVSGCFSTTIKIGAMGFWCGLDTAHSIAVFCGCLLLSLLFLASGSSVPTEQPTPSDQHRQPLLMLPL
jgi:hypothetical protein